MCQGWNARKGVDMQLLTAMLWGVPSVRHGAGQNHQQCSIRDSFAVVEPVYSGTYLNESDIFQSSGWFQQIILLCFTPHHVQLVPRMLWLYCSCTLSYFHEDLISLALGITAATWVEILCPLERHGYLPHPSLLLAHAFEHELISVKRVGTRQIGEWPMYIHKPKPDIVYEMNVFLYIPLNVFVT